jgi:uncharacterized protein DUF3300
MTLGCKLASAIDLAPSVLRSVHAALRACLIAVLLSLVGIATPASAQSAGEGYTQDELDQLLAPIALYPDQLLTQILIAATYPLEVVEAARFVQQNPTLKSDALDQALADKNWDPSVQSLAAYPQVLAMMNDKLEWTQRLGDAFLADQARVMDTVQSLRQRAQAAGNLQSTPQLSVTRQEDDIVIDTGQPDVVYVPVYNPLLIYGPWWAPAYPPWFWCPPPSYAYPFCPVYTIGIVFGPPWPIWYNHWGWARPHWHGHRIAIDDRNNRFWNNPRHPRPPPGGTWQHSPPHRRGVAYPNVATRDRFMRIEPDAVRARQDFRGYERIQPAPNAIRQTPRPVPNEPNVARQMPNAGRSAREAPTVTVPTPTAARPAPVFRTTTPPFDPTLSRQQTQINAQRGVQSRQSIPSAPASVGHAAVVPAPASRAPPPQAPAPQPGPQGGAGRR